MDSYNEQQINHRDYAMLEQRKIQLIIIGFFFAIGLLFRLYSVLATDDNFIYNRGARDAVNYLDVARVLKTLSLSDYPVPREPGYPLVLALTFLIFPNNFTTARFTTAIIGAFCIPLTFITANSLKNRLVQEGKNNSILISYVSSFLVTINPYTILTDGWGLREPLSGCLILSLLYFVFKIQKNPTRNDYILLTILSIATFSVKFEIFLVVISLLIILVFYQFSHRDISNTDWKNYSIIASIVVIAFLLEHYLFRLKFGYSISDFHASYYFHREFGHVEPNMTLKRYLFEFHTLSQIFSYLYHGIASCFQLYNTIFGLYGFCLIVIGFSYLLSKNAFELPVTVFIPIGSLAFFLYAIDMAGNPWRFFLPYVPLLCICISYALIMVISDLTIQIKPKKTITINKSLLISLILMYFTMIYLSAAFREISRLIR